jgi:AcrR family transcriptional regulator
MGETPTYRESNRARLREALIGAARELAVTRGWDGVRMLDVARAAGVSRQTVYNEFGGRAGLAEAMAVNEVDHFVRRIREELERHGADARSATYAATVLTLEEAARNPLVRAILTGGRGSSDTLLPYLTTRADVVLDAAAVMMTGWSDAHLPQIPAAAVARASETWARLVISHIMRPRHTPAETADAIAEVVVRLLS